MLLFLDPSLDPFSNAAIAAFITAFSSLLISALIFAISPDESIGSLGVHYCSDQALDARVACVHGNMEARYEPVF